MANTESFTVSGVNNKSQGADFIHEELNRQIKSFLPPGHVTKETWKTVCRNADNLTEIQSRVLSISGMPQVASKKKPVKLENVVNLMRYEMRIQNFTTKPDLGKAPVSLHGVTLDEKLAFVKDKARMLYREYKDKLIEAQMFCHPKLDQIAITNEENISFNCIQNKSKQTIYEECQKLIDMLTDSDISSEFRKQLKAHAKKETLVNLYFEVTDALNDQLAVCGSNDVDVLSELNESTDES